MVKEAETTRGSAEKEFEGKIVIGPNLLDPYHISGRAILKNVSIAQLAFTTSQDYFDQYNQIAKTFDTIAKERLRAEAKKMLFEVVPTGDFPINFFERKYQGVSLSDIEKLPPKQDTQDMLRVIAFWQGLTLGSVKDKKRARSTIAFLTTISLGPIKNPNLSMHPRYQRIRSRLLPTFELYKRHLLSGVEEGEDNELYTALIYIPLTFTPIATLYALETTGLTLETVQKLIEQRKNESITRRGSHSLLRFIFKIQQSSLNVFLREVREYGSGPEYDLFDPKTDRIVEDALSRHFRGNKQGSEDFDSIYQKSKDGLSGLASYRHDIYRQTRETHSLPLFPIPNHPIFDQALIYMHKRSVMHLKLRLKNSTIYLNIDIDANNNLYGLPSTLARQNPHAYQVLINGIMPQLLPQIAEAFPQTAEAIKRQKAGKISMQTNNHFTAQKQEPRKEPKKKIRYKTQNQEAVFPDKQGDTTPENTPVNFVAYDESSIRAFHKKIAFRDLNGIMHVLKRFEYGAVQAKPLNKDPYPQFQGNCYSLRSGIWRIILLSNDNKNFEVAEIGNRDKIYEEL